MRAISAFLTCLWPGLAPLWFLGQWRGLAVAVGFSFALNGLLSSTFLRPDLLPATWLITLWIILGLFWVVETARAMREFSTIRMSGTRPTQAEEDLFLPAQSEYLRGHWFEAEALVLRHLRQFPHDADAHLLLATLYRRTKRLAESVQQLDRLDLLDGAERWRWEIWQERRLVKVMQDGEQASPTDNDSRTDSGAPASQSLSALAVEATQSTSDSSDRNPSLCR